MSLSKNKIANIAIFFAFIWLYACICHHPNVNEISRFGLTSGIVDRNCLNIDPVAEFTIDKAFFNGHYYCDKAPGLSLVAVPAYFMYKKLFEPFFTDWLKTKVQMESKEGVIAFEGLAYQFKLWATRAFTVSLISAIFAVFFLNYLTDKSGLNGAILGFAYALGTMAFCYSTVFYAHQPVAAIIFLAFFLVREKNDYKYLLADFLPGFFIGLSFVFEMPTLLIGVLIGLYYLQRVFFEHKNDVEFPKKIYRFIVFSTGAFFPLLVMAAYNYACFGNIFKSGYSFLVEGTAFKREMSKGFFGICHPSIEAIWQTSFGPRKGIFILSPFLLLLFPAFYFHLQKFKMEKLKNADYGMICCWAILIVYFLFNASYRFWDGGAAIGPRHLIPAIPFAVFLCASLDKKWFWFILFLSTISIVFGFVVTTTDPQTSALYPLWQESLPMFLSCKISLTPFHFIGFSSPISLLLYLIPPLLIISSIAIYSCRICSKNIS